MTSRTVFVRRYPRFSGVFLSRKVNVRISVQSPVLSHQPRHVTDVTLGVNGLWLGTRTEAGATANLKLSWPQLMAPRTASHGISRPKSNNKQIAFLVKRPVKDPSYRYLSPKIT